MENKHIECLDGKIGTIFSEFLTNIIQSSYDGLKGKINLNFYRFISRIITICFCHGVSRGMQTAF